MLMKLYEGKSDVDMELTLQKYTKMHNHYRHLL